MRIQDNISIESITRELETALCIDAQDYEIQSFDEICENVKRRIKINYQVDVSTSAFDEESSSIIGPDRRAASTFLSSIASLYANVCAYGHIVRFRQRNDVDLRKVKCFGYVEYTLKAALFAGQSERTMAGAENALRTVVDNIYSVQFCLEKRLFIIAMVAYEFKLKELSACIFEILSLSLIGGSIQ